MAFTLLGFLAFPIAVFAQQTSILFVDGQADEQFAGSVVGQDACGTTIDLVCTAGVASLPGGYGTISCDPSGFVSGFASASATYSGNSIYEVYQSFAIPSNGGIEMQVTGTCSIYGTTSAICSGDASVSTAGIRTVIPAVTTYTGAEASAKFFQVPITGGSITAHTEQCSTPAPFATPSANVLGVGGTQSARPSVASAAGAGKVEVRKVVVVPGAAALLAGAAWLAR